MAYDVLKGVRLNQMAKTNRRAYRADQKDTLTKRDFVITRYTIPTKHPCRLRIALVADLHDRPCEPLLGALREQQPDVIAVAGDLLERFTPDDGVFDAFEDLDEQIEGYPSWKKTLYHVLYYMDALYGWLHRVRRDETEENANAYAFLKAAVQIAPTYYALGNHERYVNNTDRAAITATGAVLLDNTYTTAEVVGCTLSIGGLSSRGLTKDTSWLADFCNAEAPGTKPALKVLLCHHPEYYPQLDEARYRLDTIDLILSGHAHGGQMCIFGKPLFAPGQGFFPKLTGGVYNGRLIISRGLSDTAHTPRINNPMELVMIDIAEGNHAQNCE